MDNTDVATARVKLTLDVRVNGTWGRDCSIGQLVEQATKAAINIIHNELKHSDANIIGTPEVTMVTHIKPKVP